MSRDVDTAALRCFVTAVRTGSMGRAAEVLGRTQPAISQQLRRLEDILDCSLLRRIASGVVMTPEGEAFLPLAERILALNDEAQAHVRAAPAGAADGGALDCSRILRRAVCRWRSRILPTCTPSSSST